MMQSREAPRHNPREKVSREEWEKENTMRRQENDRFVSVKPCPHDAVGQKNMRKPYANTVYYHDVCVQAMACLRLGWLLSINKEIYYLSPNMVSNVIAHISSTSPTFFYSKYQQRRTAGVRNCNGGFQSLRKEDCLNEDILGKKAVDLSIVGNNLFSSYGIYISKIPSVLYVLASTG